MSATAWRLSAKSESLHAVPGPCLLASSRLIALCQGDSVQSYIRELSADHLVSCSQRFAQRSVWAKMLLPLLQARLTYELAMANRDAASVDDGRDFDDRMSDDSSGEPPPWLCLNKQVAVCPIHRLLLEKHSTLKRQRELL